MKCSNISRCKNINLIKIYDDGYFLCLNCSAYFKRNKKILIKCCKKQIINRRTKYTVLF